MKTEEEVEVHADKLSNSIKRLYRMNCHINVNLREGHFTLSCLLMISWIKKFWFFLSHIICRSKALLIQPSHIFMNLLSGKIIFYRKFNTEAISIAQNKRKRVKSTHCEGVNKKIKTKIHYKNSENMKEECSPKALCLMWKCFCTQLPQTKKLIAQNRKAIK